MKIIIFNLKEIGIKKTRQNIMSKDARISGDVQRIEQLRSMIMR